MMVLQKSSVFFNHIKSSSAHRDRKQRQRWSYFTLIGFLGWLGGWCWGGWGWGLGWVVVVVKFFDQIVKK